MGVTHYTDSIHAELEKVISNISLDFVQFNYAITARNAERRLLPAAADNGVATLINRPFVEGALFAKVKGKAVLSGAAAYGITMWSPFF